MTSARETGRPDRCALYAFRLPGRTGWELAACHPDDLSPEASVRLLHADLTDWRSSGLGLNAVRQLKGVVELLGRDHRGTFSGHGEQTWAWDDVAECWRAPDETITPPPYVETVERLGVAFSQPYSGWIDLVMSTPTQSVEWPLSEVYDPFRSELTSWMETIVEQSQARLFVNVEHMHARLDVIQAEADMVILVAHSVAATPEKPPLAVKMPRSAFVKDFYLALVSFWEGEDLRRNWRNWLRGIDDWEPGKDAKGYWITEPWLIRSSKVEQYLAECRE